MNTFLPNANAVLIVEGEATGCINLTEIALTDITTRSDSVTVRLPKPELCSWKINHNRSRVYDTQFSFLDDAQLVSDAYPTGGAGFPAIIWPDFGNITGRMSFLSYHVLYAPTP